MTRGKTIRFTPADQQTFATLSGDFNPVHVDPIAARRIAAGEPIVHGMHVLLRMLDRHFTHASTPPRALLAATFLQPAFLNESIQLDSDTDGTLWAHADGGVPLVSAHIRSAPVLERAIVSFERGPRRSASPVRIPNVWTLADLDGQTGVIDLTATSRTARAFPNLSRALGRDIGAAIAAISRLVGMECPGHDSLLSALRLEIAPRTTVRRLAWRVTRVDRRFALVRIEVSSEAVSGTVDAFVRSQPAPPPLMRDAAARVAAGEFAGQRALIVGGSRGLGAATAMLIAAGGGLPIVTYATGAAEAAVLQHEARAAGRRIDALRLDVLDDNAGNVVAEAAARAAATHVYYYATPRIFARRREPFDDRLFERFAAFYVTAFGRICLSVARAIKPLDVFYPSSTAVDETPPELTEYAAAKAAGESLCRTLQRPDDGLRIHVRRLPRVKTDQTASLLTVPALDPFDAALPIVREIQRSCAATTP
jgi:NAD(P)-dependent dehydrogenase (short-subunit alcohol dehydrogenase family)